MTEGRIRIDGPAESLEAIRRELLDEGIEVRPVSTTVPGELREPILTALIVGDPTTGVAIYTLGEVIKRCLQHRERMAELKLMRENSDRELTIAELLAAKSDS